MSNYIHPHRRTTDAQTTAKKTNIVVARCSPTEKAKVEALADAFDCSQAGVIRRATERHYHDIFGDTDPTLVATAAEALDHADFEALVAKMRDADTPHEDFETLVAEVSDLDADALRAMTES